jgi:hypothetical protein
VLICEALDEEAAIEKDRDEQTQTDEFLYQDGEF